MSKVLLLSLMICITASTSAFSSEKVEEKKTSPTQTTGKGLDTDKLKCSWNKTPEEIEKHCKDEVPQEEKVATKLDKRLKKDAKTIKKFFGIDNNNSNKKADSEVIKE